MPTLSSEAAYMPIEIDIWMWRLVASDEALRRFEAILPKNTIARAAGFLDPAHGRQHIVAHGRLREIIALYLHRPPQMLNILVGPHGKPCLVPEGTAKPALHYNLSHSSELAALAVCRSLPLGVDIEAHRPVTEGLAERYFAAEEIRALAASPDTEREAAFFRCWTRKEALIKALARGMAQPLKGFAVDINARNAVPLVRGLAEDGAHDPWRIVPFDPAPGFSGAVAIPSGDRAICLTVRRTDQESPLLEPG